jgi:hypothetical protein
MASAQHVRVIADGGIWADLSLLKYVEGDDLTADNSANPGDDYIVEFKNRDGAVIGTMPVPPGATNLQVIPIGTVEVCIQQTSNCFPAVMGIVPSMTTYGLIVLVVLLGISALWIYRRRRVATTA